MTIKEDLTYNLDVREFIDTKKVKEYVKHIIDIRNQHDFSQSNWYLLKLYDLLDDFQKGKL